MGGLTVQFLVNDLSIAGQFHDVSSFREAIRRLMDIRREIQRLGSSLYCHRRLASARVTANTVMQQAVQALPLAERLALIQWLTTHGPYWEDGRNHGADDWVEVSGEIVTDTAVGEAAICQARGLRRDLVSFTPSAWTSTPVRAVWKREATADVDVLVSNHWETPSVQACLQANPPSTLSWSELGSQMTVACTRLTFAEDAFEPLEGQPFAPSAAERIRVLLHTLDGFKACFDDQGQRTAEGHRIYADHFTGNKAWFSDSSDAEKNDFRTEMTFRHPANLNEWLFCTWHGKVKSPQIRIHFSWPVRADEPLYVVYVGPKITKR